ncbi:MAG: L,D-transpeptidase family protein [Dehalococcoidales bacterium]|nr:L,D-transpeptidase family protein [Dehalococcoidales bacterium]
MLKRLIPLAIALAIGFTLLPMATSSAAAASSIVYVTDGPVNVRTGPSTRYAIATRVYTGDAVVVTGTTSGQSVQGTSTWYRTKSGWYISGAFVSGSRTAATSGRWIDVNLSTLTARAMVGNTAVYSAPIVSGMAGFRTPTGNFRIISRPGTIDMSWPGLYYQPNVPYTQFFDGAGDAIHGNYWSPRGAFGNYNTSHGCVGLRNGDAAYFWSFGSIGMPVRIHY